jgi:hypothetical protein
MDNIDVGTSTRDALKSVPEAKRREILLGIRDFFYITAEYLQKNLPLSNSFLKNLYCLAIPQIKCPESEQSFRYLMSALPQTVVEDEVTTAMDEWKMLVLDDTPNEWAKSASSDTPTAIDVRHRHHILSRKNPLEKVKYPTSVKVVKACHIFSHGNADAESSFSVNKRVVTIERSNLMEATITAIRLVKDGIRCHGGSANNVKVNKDMIHKARGANILYKDYLAKQKEAAKEAQKEKAMNEARRQQLEKEKTENE